MGAIHVLVFLKFIAYIEGIKPKSVNLALETVLEFNKNSLGDAKFINTVQKFLDQAKTVISPKNIERRVASENKYNIKFTDFIKTAIRILKSYDDDDLEDVIAVFDDEIRKSHYRGCKFHELITDQDVRRFVANKLDNLRDKPAWKLRRNLDKVIETIEDSKFSTRHVEFIDYINSLYRQDSSEKLKLLLGNLQAYSSKSKRANLNLIKVVRDGIRSVIFDHYSELNANARRDLKTRLETTWIKLPKRVHQEVWSVNKENIDENSAKNYTKNRHANYIKQELTARTETKPDTERDETSDNEQEYLQTTPHYKPKLSHKNHRDGEEETQEVTLAKHVTLKKTQNNPKKLYTQYPEKITSNTKNWFKLESTTEKARLHTMLEGKNKLKSHKHKKNKRKSSKSKTILRKQAHKPRLITESETMIIVKGTGLLSVEDDKNSKHMPRHHTKNREPNSTPKHHKGHKTKTRESKHKPTTNYTFRRHIPRLNPHLSEEGMSIEGYVKRRAMEENSNSDTSAQRELNVLKTSVNNLRRQMEDMNNKINIKLTTANDSLMSVTKFRELEIWTGNTAPDTTLNDTVSESYNTLSTQSTKEIVENTSERNPDLQSDLSTNADITFRNAQERNVSDTGPILPSPIEDANNEVGMDLDEGIINIMNEYNNSAMPNKVWEDTMKLGDDANPKKVTNITFNLT